VDDDFSQDKLAFDEKCRKMPHIIVDHPQKIFIQYIPARR